jgi:hypothetical protein
MAKGGPTEVDAFDLLQALKEHWENTEGDVKLLCDHADYLEKEIKIAVREGQELGQRPRERVNELEEDISSMEHQVRAACALLLAAVRDLCARVSARALQDGHPGSFSERRHGGAQRLARALASLPLARLRAGSSVSSLSWLDGSCDSRATKAGV